MSFKSLTSPSTGSAGGSHHNNNLHDLSLTNKSQLDTHKRHFSHDEDNTFLPPALSSYSIALLNDRTKNFPIMNTSSNSNSNNNTSTNTNNNITGIYELDFPDNKRTSSLRNKLSVHFKEASPLNQINNNNDNNNNNNNIKDIRPISRQNSVNSVNTPDNINNSSAQDFYLSSHNSFNLSINNYSSHTHTTTDEDIMGEEAASPHSTSSRTPATTPGSIIPNSTDNKPSVNSINSSRNGNTHTVKRARRFGKSLGPPKRASRFSDNYDKIDLENNENNALTSTTSSPPPTFNLNNFSPKISSIIRMPSNDNSNPNRINYPPPLDSHSFVVSNDHKIPDLMDFQLPQENDNKPPITNNFNIPNIEPSINPKMTNKLNDIIPSEDQENLEALPKHSKIHKTERKPLSSVSISQINSQSDFETFRKPKLPKSTSQISEPQQEQKVISTVSEIIPLASPAMPTEDNKKKKTIIINGVHYEKLELLGRGGTSKVYKVKALANNRLYAIKKVTFDQFDESCVKGFKGEIDLLLKLKHADRVVKLVDHAVGEGSIYLIMECGDIDLAHVLQNKLASKSVLDLNFVRYHAIEVFKCVQAVHESGIVHSDLKPANFLFVRGILKIIDFGIANAVPDHTANIYRESQIGTPNYMAPEALVEVNQSFPGLPMSDQNLSNQRNTWKVGKPSDVWSCGCIIYQMIYGKPPYGGYSGNQRIMAIVNPQVKIQFPNKGIGGVPVPISAIELMKNCLERNPNDRWTVDRCLTSDFLKPKVVSENFVRDLVHSAVNYGYNKRTNGSGPMAIDVYDALVDSVLLQIENLNYA
ncbi:protein kinase [Scheffersomyces coipomensis]|uniref:protein kinase n=1 Tax=Scheffersomyces coipomensis TaxID=1788519 RepID=UPI00315C6B1C